MGLENLKAEDIVTSGMMASEFIRNKITSGKVAYIGTSQAASYIIDANTDIIYPVAKNDVSLATGGIAQLVENVIDREFIKFGKPDSQMFMFAMEHLQHNGMQVERKDILMVGDTLHTDILGGNKFGIKTALVLSGNTTERNAQLLINATGVVPDYIFESIAF